MGYSSNTYTSDESIKPEMPDDGGIEFQFAYEAAFAGVYKVNELPTGSIVKQGRDRP